MRWISRRLALEAKPASASKQPYTGAAPTAQRAELSLGQRHSGRTGTSMFYAPGVVSCRVLSPIKYSAPSAGGGSEKTVATTSSSKIAARVPRVGVDHSNLMGSSRLYWDDIFVFFVEPFRGEGRFLTVALVPLPKGGMTTCSAP